MSGATIGKLIAGVAFLVVGGVVALSVVRGMRERAPAAEAPFVPGAAPTGDVTIVDLPSGRDAASELFDTGEAWVFRSPDGSGREREYRADALEPQGGGRIRLRNPSATIPTDDGWIEVRAAEGTIVRRSGGEPESGELTGGVVVTGFRTGTTNAVGTFRTDHLSFQESLRELRTESDIALDAEGLSVRSRGLTVRLGDTGDAATSGLLYLRLHQGGRVEVRPGAMQDKSTDDPARPARKEDRRPNAPAAPPVETFYRVLAAGDVDLTWGAATLRGDRAEVLARLVDGALAPGAIRTLEAGEDAVATDGAGAPDDAPPPAPSPGAPAPASEAVLTWVGALELQRVETRPDEIALSTGDEAAIRWFGIGKNAVRASDASVGFGAEAAEIRYGLTSARVRLAGKPGLHEVVVTGADLGELRSHHAELDLGDLPNITAWVDGVGSVRPRGAPDAEATEVTWHDRADLTAVRAADGNARLTSVSASGPVRVITPSGTVDATFARAFLSEGPGPSVLERVILREGFTATAAQSGDAIEAERAEVRFALPTDGSIAGPPEFVRATGAVRITRAGTIIDADAIAAELATLPGGDPDLRAGDAEGSVRIAVSKGVEVRSPRARVDEGGDLVRLDGPGSGVVFSKDAQTVEVRAESMEVRRSTGRIAAAGPGTLVHRIEPTEAGPGSMGELTWTEGLVYDDASGIAELLGAVEGERSVELAEIQRVRALGGATVSLVPGVMVEDADARPRITGILLRGSPDTPAEVENRRYATGSAPELRGPLESVLALRSDEIAFDLDRSVLTTPGAGVLVAENRRVHTAGTDPDGAMGVSARGTTAFRWSGSFTLDRLAGLAVMRENVRVSHLDAIAGDVTELVAQAIEATFAPSADASPTTDVADLVRTITARDRVRLDHRTLTLECDTIDFDASGNRFTARAAEGSRVRGLDRTRGDSFLAESVRVDPRTGEWAAEGLTGISSGR
jgi:hypothetical protein